MPGHMLLAQCSCGFSSGVNPGATFDGILHVIAYNPEAPGLLTVEEREAKEKGLHIIENPYLQYWRRSMSDPEVQRLAGDASFICPKCRQPCLRFAFMGFWD